MALMVMTSQLDEVTDPSEPAIPSQPANQLDLIRIDYLHVGIHEFIRHFYKEKAINPF